MAPDLSPALRMLLSALAFVAALYVAVALLLFLMQSRLIYHPQIGRDVTTTPRAAGLDFEDVWLDAGDDVRLHGWYVGRENAQGVALILHGNAGSIALRLDWLRMFHDLGYAAFIVDYRGYGRSSGSPSEEGTYEDARLAWAHLESRGWKGEDIVLLGESLGGAVAAHLAARERPRALILHSTFTSVPDMAAQLYRFLPVRWLARFRYDTRAALRDVQAPVLIAHSPRDEIVPFTHAQALFAAASDPKRLLELAGGHNDGFIFVRPEWVRVLGNFLAESGRARPQSTPSNSAT
jgi:fermentation-respiration switch protein FrsA (DUF1100 family)